ncbi:C-type lectin domain family 7 member A isoform X3 [Megalobrama amblycephala]|uniref:C-type lectin domain family 7 member A isoform X3 n=1 Tax=Megalobrama amblycephala TaxID=75352 RepID=UPI00201425BD|nr:C-type lectin domain family 7 member A isoform X3 [Megalobrama amblycephala]
MEEEFYSTVIFKPYDNEKPTESDETVLYAEVKRLESTLHTTSETSDAQCSLKESVLPTKDCLTEEEGSSTPVSPACRRAAVFLGLLCFLLVAAVTTAQQTKERANNLQLLEVLKQEKARLVTHGQQMNSTLDFIIRRSRFPVDKYCQSTGNGVRCTPCPQNWIQNGSSCYYFRRHSGNAWKTWKESQEYCEDYGAHLAIIDSEGEQEFINQHTNFDQHYGYWIGLYEKTEKNWVWINGAKLEKGFWVSSPAERYMYCVLSMPSNNPQKSWRSASCSSSYKWICEVEVLTWPTFLQAQQNHSNPSI